MKKRPCYLLIFILLSLFTLFLLQHSQHRYYTSNNAKSAQQESNSYHHHDYQPHQQQQQQQHDEQFLSYFPIGDFLDQMNSFRNGLKLALDTNRTLILPYLQLSKTPNDWIPFDEMAKRYQAQDKTALYSLCNSAVNIPNTLLVDKENNSNDLPLEITYCQHLDSWTDIPWSVLFDLSFLNRHSIRVVERHTLDWRKGGGWMNDNNSVMIMDPLTFWKNGTTFDTHEEQPSPKQQQQQQQQQQQFLFESGPTTRGWWSWLKNSLQRQDQQTANQQDLPLAHRFVSSLSLQQLDARLIQFGSLAQNSVVHTSKSKEEVRLLDDVAKLMVPNRLLSLKHMAGNIVHTLGGSQGFTSFHLHLTTLIEQELSLLQVGNDLLLDEVESTETAKNTTLLLADSFGGSTDTRLDSRTFLEMMNAIAFELLGDIPINQAVSAALPIQPSSLREYLDDNNGDGFKLLKACVDYRTNVDRRYPVIYFVTDGMDITDRTSLAPLLELFPCLFTRNDLQKWNLLQPGWSSFGGGIGMDDKLIDYDEFLGPFLDILVADESYSMMEMPLTPLSAFITNQRHHK